MTRQVIFTIFLVLLLAGIGYIWYKYAPPSADNLETRREPVGARLIELRRLKTLQLDVSILRDKSFGTLNDPGQVLPVQEVSSDGRLNPFLPF